MTGDVLSCEVDSGHRRRISQERDESMPFDAPRQDGRSFSVVSLPD